MLKDTYGFYKNSSKRKDELNSTVPRSDQLLEIFLQTIEEAVKEGEEELAKIPSLRLKKWNATRWLGRAACLKAICDAYEHILEHLHTYSRMSLNSKKSRDIAADLYERLTSYDTLVFIWFYRDLAEAMARSSKQLQSRAVTIRDVGRIIMNLQEVLKSSYPKDSLVPRALIGSGEADTILHNLFRGDISCISLGSKRLADYLAIHDLEEQLHHVPVPVTESIESSIQPVRTTRGVNNSAKYADILSKKSREERVPVPAIDTEPLEKDVISTYFLD